MVLVARHTKHIIHVLMHQPVANYICDIRHILRFNIGMVTYLIKPSFAHITQQTEMSLVVPYIIVRNRCSKVAKLCDMFHIQTTQQ